MCQTIAHISTVIVLNISDTNTKEIQNSYTSNQTWKHNIEDAQCMKFNKDDDDNVICLRLSHNLHIHLPRILPK